MARRSGKSTNIQQLSDGLFPIIVLIICFLGSGLAGCLIAASSGENSSASLSSYLCNYLALLSDREAVSPSVWAVLWEICCWPLLVFLLGLTALGALAIPAAFCVRGFLLAYAIAAFAQVFGKSGLLAALAVFGMTALVSIPILFSIGTIAFPSSLNLARGVLGERSSGPYFKEYLVQLLPCGALVVFAVVIQRSVMPQLLYIVSEMLVSVNM